MNISDPWHLQQVEKRTPERQFPGAVIAMDDGAQSTSSANRARRMVALWNAFLGVPLRDIQKLTKRRMEQKGWLKRKAGARRKK